MRVRRIKVVRERPKDTTDGRDGRDGASRGGGGRGQNSNYNNGGYNRNSNSGERGGRARAPSWPSGGGGGGGGSGSSRPAGPSPTRSFQGDVSKGGMPPAPDVGGGRGDGRRKPGARKDYEKKDGGVEKKKKAFKRRPDKAEGRMSRRGSLKRKTRTSSSVSASTISAARVKVVVRKGESVSVVDLAEWMGKGAGELLKYAMVDMGMLVTANASVDDATARSIVEGFGMVVDDGEGSEGEDEDEEEEGAGGAQGDAEGEGRAAQAPRYSSLMVEAEDDSSLVSRPAVVTVMGHVDHGKTSLLDCIRKTDVTEGEAGGITQHISAYQVGVKSLSDSSPHKTITFIDTPGHEAFNDMRARGADITDIVVLVVAGNDGVKQQTIDSLECAKAAGVPVVIAVNKKDVEEGYDLNRVLTDLTSHDILTEQLGGEVLCEEVSAKTGEGVEDLLEKVALQAEMLGLKANPDRDAMGVVVEARMEKGLGNVATVLVQKGTLKTSDAFVAGQAQGKVRALVLEDSNRKVDSVGPSTPVKVVGFQGTPCAGDMFIVASDLGVARDLALSRQRLTRERESETYQKGLMSNVADLIENGLTGRKTKKEMSVVIKSDVMGSSEAIANMLGKLKIEDDESYVEVNVLRAEVGDVTKEDVTIAAVRDDTTIIAFNCAANMAAMDAARVGGVSIEYFDVIYDAIDSVQSRMQEVLSPTPQGEYVGKAVVKEVFNIGGTGNIAGSKCTDGNIRKGSNVRVMRGDKILCQSKVRTLRNLKSEVEAIEQGVECGIGLQDFEEFEVGDVIESFVINK